MQSCIDIRSRSFLFLKMTEPKFISSPCERDSSSTNITFVELCIAHLLCIFHHSSLSFLYIFLSPHSSMNPRFRVSRRTFTVALVVLLTYSYFYLSSHLEGDLDFGVLNGTGNRHPSSPLDKSHSSHRGLLQWWSPSASEEPLGVLKFTGDGLVRGWDGVYNKLKSSDLKRSARKKLQLAMETHPILELMERNRERWQSILAR